MTRILAHFLLLFLLLFSPPLSRRGACQNPQPSPAPLVLLENRTALIREETVLVSIPFPKGRIRGLPNLAVKDLPTAWRILETWPDGSTRVAQAQFPLRLSPRERANLPLAPGKPLAGPFRPHRWIPKDSHAPSFAIEAALPGAPIRRIPLRPGGTILDQTPLVRTTRRVLSLGEGWTLRVYFTEFSATPVLQADLVLTAPRTKETRPAFLHLDALETSHPLMILHPRLSGAGAPLRDKEGRLHHPLLVNAAPRKNQAFRWRVFLLLDSPKAPTLQRGIARRTWQAMALRPLDALCDPETWLASGALTLFGGPAPPPSDWKGRILRETAFRAGKGPFGRYSLPPFPSKGPEAARVPPCDPFWLHAVQTSRGGLLEYLQPGFDAWTARGAWWARDLFLDRVREVQQKAGAAKPPLAPAAEGLLARVLAEAALAQPGKKPEETRTFLAGRISRLLPLLEKTPSLVPSSQAAPFLLGMYAAWRHLKVDPALDACRLVLRTLPEKPGLPSDLALPLHLLSQVPSLPAALKEKAARLSRSLLAPLPQPERLWSPRAALVPWGLTKQPK